MTAIDPQHLCEESPPIHARLYCRNPDSPSKLCLWYWCEEGWELAAAKLERIIQPQGPVLAVFDGARSSYPDRTLPYHDPRPSGDE